MDTNTDVTDVTMETNKDERDETMVTDQGCPLQHLKLRLRLVKLMPHHGVL